MSNQTHHQATFRAAQVSPDEQRVERAAGLISTALAIQLIENGWTLHTQPGELFFSQGDDLVVPRQLIDAIRSGKTTASAWRDWCVEKGLAALPLTQPTIDPELTKARFA